MVLNLFLKLISSIFIFIHLNNQNNFYAVQGKSFKTKRL